MLSFLGAFTSAKSMGELFFKRNPARVSNSAEFRQLPLHLLLVASQILRHCGPSKPASVTRFRKTSPLQVLCGLRRMLISRVRGRLGCLRTNIDGVRVADMAAYRVFIGSVIWALPGVRETRTYVVMEEVKNTAAIAV